LPIPHPHASRPLRRLGGALASALVALGLGAGSATAAFNGGAPAYAPGEVVVGYQAGTGPSAQAATARAVGARAGMAPSTRTRVLHVPTGKVRATVARLRRLPGVAYAAPNPIAHISQQEPGLPNDPGIRGYPGGLAALQWNFFGDKGVNAMEAWGNVAAAGAPGGRGVRVAVLDTGVAYRNIGRYKRSPDFANTKFVAAYDFVDNRREVVDRNGHGTHVAGTIAESTNNRIGVSGLAWGATIIPIRVLDSNGYGDAATIAKGIRYAARHNAKVINMSLEFSTSVRASEIPDIISAIRYANQRGAVVVGSTGNEGEARVAYPARTGIVIAVGATTDDGCLASYSNDGVGIDIVGPGGGSDAQLSQDPSCVVGHQGRDIYQMTYLNSISRFGLPSGYRGTSMAAPHVSATAALVIASKVLGPSPTPAQVECRIKATARRLGIPGPNRIYGWGLVDAGAATSSVVASPSCMASTARANPR
jgi:serine protease